MGHNWGTLSIRFSWEKMFIDDKNLDLNHGTEKLMTAWILIKRQMRFQEDYSLQNLLIWANWYFSDTPWAAICTSF